MLQFAYTDADSIASQAGGSGPDRDAPVAEFLGLRCGPLTPAAFVQHRPQRPKLTPNLFQYRGVVHPRSIKSRRDERNPKLTNLFVPSS